MPRKDEAPFNYSALIGAYLAVNAISDAYMLVDSTDCSLYKTQYIHGRHDWNSTLLRSDGFHRISFSNVCVQGAVGDHDAPLRGRVRAMDAVEDAGVVFVTAMPLCSLTCVDYGRMLRETTGLRRPAIDVPAESLSGDWLDGYATMLESIARRIELPRVERRPGAVALVGYLMDRNEGDHRGNLSELSRLLSALGLEVVSIWLDGGPYAGLARAAEAETVIALPYALGAARVLAQRTGARVVEARLPFGLESTGRFLREVAAATGRAEAAERLIAAELARVTPGLRWILPHLFVGRRVLFLGDPHLASGFAEIAEDLGLRPTGFVATGRERHARVAAAGRATVLFEPGVASAELKELLSRPVDVAVAATCTMGELFDADVPTVEVGFPSYWQHSLARRPFLGYEGFLCLVDRIGDALAGRLRRMSVERLSAKSGRLA
ncbi:MAG: hypothetical protein HKL90_06790 [Elusimicrobia bacterium]|nr:hypothetical protein [Elusimicrobiota bacterium]